MTAVVQSILDPAGPQAAHISRLWWLTFWVSTAVFALVLGFLAVALARGRPTGVRVDADRRLTRAVTMAVAATTVILFVLLVASVWTSRIVASLGAASAVTINVVGHQFWWEIEYEDAVPSRRVVTANEIHIPVGRPVVLKVTSRDVIHSFWAPNLHGKRDLVPGIMSAVWLQADAPAVYRGQCGEFCGRQHAHMAFEVVAEPQGQFDGWLDAQRRGAAEPQTADQAHGRDVFMTAQCILCHTIRGTGARGQIGPDLTHVGTRGKIASGTLPNTASEMARWVRDPQHVKPGNQMPPSALAAAEVQAVAVYLESLR
jgi:cytochrome c oxidase subunit 2